MRRNFRSFLLLSFAAIAATAHARTANENLKNQFDNDPNRVLPQGEKYSLGVDGYLFKNPPDDFYHGGYWYSSFLELRYVPNITINAKVAVYDPGVSYGVASAIEVQPFVGITGAHHFEGIDLDAKLRAGDLDRQTIGAGLTFDEHEMNGAILSLKKDPVELQLLNNGTGGYVRCADINVATIKFFGDVVGAYYMQTSADSTCKTEEMNSYSYSFAGVFSKHTFRSGFYYRLEASERNKSTAGMLQVGHALTLNQSLMTDISYQYRKYDDRFAEGYVGRIYQDYVSVEQRDKDYVNSMNIFVTDDDVKVHAGKIDAHIFPKDLIRAFSENEFGAFDFQNGRFQRFYYFHHALQLCPNAGRDDCFSIGYADKITNTKISTRIPGTEGSEPYFRSIRHWRIEAEFRF